MRDACAAAVDAALGAGASYADARAIVRRSQQVSTRDGRVVALNDVETEGIGVRVLVAGAWGFACDRRLDPAGGRDAALRASGFAAAAGRNGNRALAPLEACSGTYRTSVEIDPFAVPLEDKVGLCLRAEQALRRPEVKVTQASVRALHERKFFLSSNGAEIDQELVETGGGIDATAVSTDGIVQERSYPSAHVGSSAQAGWEYVEGLDLDRVYGTEAAYAGTSFLHPEDLGTLQYGSEHMNITADPTTPLGLGTFGFDDEGVTAQRVPIVSGGVLSGFLTSRETAARIGQGAGGSMRADGWQRMPLVRMTNLHLEPGTGTLEELISEVDDGIYLETNRSWSIDDKRLNFQFGTQMAWEIKRGKLGRLLRDATYTGITPEFWGSLDRVAGSEAWVMYGLTNCGKGQPGQSAHVSHGASPARFRNVQVGVRA
jgi:TldD protein